MRFILLGLLALRLSLLYVFGNAYHDNQYCNPEYEGNCHILPNLDGKSSNIWTSDAPKQRYLLYDVNPSEGFNLRRDVYLRISILMKELQKSSNSEWILVLPPWGPLYHWHSESESKLPWSTFFRVECINNFIRVIEFHEFLDKHKKSPIIDIIYYLQQDDWDGGEWVDKVEIEKCKSQLPYKKSDEHYLGWFWGYENVIAKNVQCVTVLGNAGLLKSLITETKGVVMIDRAEVVLHDNFGDADYWRSRRSMRFAQDLTDIADEFRRNVLNSTDDQDKRNTCEEHKMTAASAVGGDYISVHLRRRDFVHSRKKDVPSLKDAARQLKKLQTRLNISVVFVASDAPYHEMQELKKLLPEMVQYVPSQEVLKKYKDGAIAIVDQWICTHAKYFVGTHESTFSFRIQEEREILGFDPDTTFNRLCADGETSCDQPARWRIIYN